MLLLNLYNYKKGRHFMDFTKKLRNCIIGEEQATK